MHEVGGLVDFRKMTGGVSAALKNRAKTEN